MFCAIKNKNKYFLKANTITKYWKYEDSAWQNPILSENGTVGGNVPACEVNLGANSAWYAFGESAIYNRGWWADSATFPHWITYYSPLKIKPTLFTFQNRSYNDSTKMAIKTGYISGSNNNIDWEEIAVINNNILGDNQIWTVNVDTQNYYKYLRVTATNSSTPSRGAWISNLKIIGQSRIAMPATVDDYDFTTEEYAYFSFVKKDVLKDSNGNYLYDSNKKLLFIGE